MFKRIRLRFKDMKTISDLVQGAEKQANQSGDEKPETEHYVIAALHLSDGTAQRVFNRLGIDVKEYKVTIKELYENALESAGISADRGQSQSIIEPSKIVRAGASGVEFMKSLHTYKQSDKDTPLLGVHVLAVVSDMKHGTAIRAFRALDIDSVKLHDAIDNELRSYA